MVFQEETSMIQKQPRSLTAPSKFAIFKCTGRPCSCIARSHGVSWLSLNPIAEGAQGTVFLAKRREQTNQQGNFPSELAVKSVPLKAYSLLKYEKDVLCKLNNSEYVIKCYGDEVTEICNGRKLYNILLEYCSGLSLCHEIFKFSKRGLPESDVRNYTRDILQGLKYVHSEGFAHCDIKPDNILLAPVSGRSVAKLADFALARTAFINKDHDSSPLKGTYEYMSPELVRERKYESAADIWALGCTVLAMITGVPAWNYQDEQDLLKFIGYSDRIPYIPSNIPEDAKDFLAKCLVKNANHRWSAWALLEHPFVSVHSGCHLSYWKETAFTCC